MQRASFYVEGPVGAFEEANTIAKLIEEFLETGAGEKYRKEL
jgi:hypothetical protein